MSTALTTAADASYQGGARPVFTIGHVDSALRRREAEGWFDRLPIREHPRVPVAITAGCRWNDLGAEAWLAQARAPSQAPLRPAAPVPAQAGSASAWLANGYVELQAQFSH
eukprot:gnl/TRDRNA2_/TRDRNA2_166928_c1_seq2.p3 gnl/TRDRNA2_/TRDRNA2_166928_c1~~gnl/TRDRNA2_/TRDRNA2_166928_c1_seq2.p3  ORF type:complete len:119 (-),score=23.79 gnl/TRDRNA2_/TRDRNA2_166928_c1_seq2:243-575(-)